MPLLTSQEDGILQRTFFAHQSERHLLKAVSIHKSEAHHIATHERIVFQMAASTHKPGTRRIAEDCL